MDVFKEIEKRAKKYDTLNRRHGLNFLIGINKDGGQVTEIDGSQSYCDDCIDKAVRYKNKLLYENRSLLGYNCTDEEFHAVVEIVSEVESSPESDDFVRCNRCGIVIPSVSVLHTLDQEVQHWLDDESGVSLYELEDQDCFIIHELIENASSKYPDLVNRLKQKIIRHQEKHGVLSEIFKDKPHLLKEPEVRKLIRFTEFKYKKVAGLTKKLQEMEDYVVEQCVLSDVMMEDGKKSSEVLRSIINFIEKS